VQSVNERQKQVLLDKITARFGAKLDGLRFAVWGLAFKPGTDDLREAPSATLVQGLLERGANVAAYDPQAMAAAQAQWPPHARLNYANSAHAALHGADALVIVTEWKEFRSPDFAFLASALRQPIVVDGRNLFDPATVLQAGLEYIPIGRRPAAPENA
jgi:UDPglucose 6-dehydrogenase